MRTKGISLTIASGILFGAVPLFTSLLYAEGFDAVSVSFYRYFMVIPMLTVACLYKKISFKITKEQFINIFFHICFFTTITILLLNYSYNFINTGAATTLHFLYPLFVIIICKFFYRDQIDKKTIRSLGIMILGILCFLGKLNIKDFFGIMLALASGITYAIYLVQLEKRKIAAMHPLQFSFHLSLYTCIILSIIALFTGSLPHTFNVNSFLNAISIAIICIIAIIFLQIGSRILGSKLTSLCSLLEPITSLLLGIVILKEPLSILKFIGCLLILLAVLNLAIDKKISNPLYSLRKLLNKQ